MATLMELAALVDSAADFETRLRHAEQMRRDLGENYDRYDRIYGEILARDASCPNPAQKSVTVLESDMEMQRLVKTGCATGRNLLHGLFGKQDVQDNADAADDNVPVSKSAPSSAAMVLGMIEEIAEDPDDRVFVSLGGKRFAVVRAEKHGGDILLMCEE